MKDNVHRLTCEDKDIVLIGTAHMSRESTDLVGRIIEEEKPDTVCIELCQARYESMTQKKRWQDTDLIKVIRTKKAFLLLSNLMLAYFQRKIGQQLGVRPGEEIIPLLGCVVFKSQVERPWNLACIPYDAYVFRTEDRPKAGFFNGQFRASVKEKKILDRIDSRKSAKTFIWVDVNLPIIIVGVERGEVEFRGRIDP